VRHNFLFDDINQALPIVMSALQRGNNFGSRAGLTKELMHVGITLTRPWQREIVLETRKANVAAQIVETMWVLAGRNDIATLEPYLPRAADFSDDGRTWRSGYGPRLRDFHGRDQLAYVVETLRANPHSRQAVINLWDPCTDTTPGKDVACNNWLSFSSRNGALDLHVGIRSNDAMWGWSGINAFEWSVLQEVVAYLAGLEVGALHFSTTSFHLYEQHWAKATRIADDPTWNPNVEDSPRFVPVEGGMAGLDITIKLWFEMEERIRTGQSVDIRLFPEPMMRSWLEVLAWYWSGDERHLQPGTRLTRAALVGTKPVGEPQPLAELLEETMAGLQAGRKVVELDVEDVLFDAIEEGLKSSGDPFLDAVNALHAEKHAAYGDSWKRRGERGILGNIARKVDRIGTGLDTTDETQADTAIDLMVYCAKYLCWLRGWKGDPLDVEGVLNEVGPSDGEATFDQDLEKLESSDALVDKVVIVERMLEQSMALARSLWLDPRDLRNDTAWNGSTYGA
jgi:thymidylate synthase